MKTPAIRLVEYEDAPAHAPLQQSAGYAAAVRALGGDARALSLRAGGRTIGHALMLHRRLAGVMHIATVLRGPVWCGAPAQAERAAALDALRRLPGRVLLQPDSAEDGAALRARGARAVMTGASLARLDLTGGEEAMRARMHGKWRNRLLRALEADVVVREDRDHGWLLSLEAAQARARGYRSLPPAFIEAFAASGRKRVLTLRAMARDETVAGMLFLIHGRAATYQAGWSGPAGRAAGAHNRLLWTAMRKLAARRIATLDLGTLDTEGAPGLARFKLGAGATVVRAPGTFL